MDSQISQYLQRYKGAECVQVSIGAHKAGVRELQRGP